MLNASSVGAGQQDAEFISSQSSDNVGLTQFAAQHFADLLQQAVALMVAAEVIDVLELVEVEQHQGKTATT